MQRKLMIATVAVIALLGLGFWLKTSKKEVKVTSALKKENLQPKDIQKLIHPEGQTQPLPVARLKKAVEESGSEALEESFQSYQATQKEYDAVLKHHADASARYRQAIQAASASNGPEVEAALAEVDAQTQALQDKNLELNEKSAAFLEEFRRYTFEKFDIAQQ